MVSSPTTRNTMFECDICGDVVYGKQNKCRHKKRRSSLLPGADDFVARIAFIKKKMLVLTMEHAYLKEKESVASVTDDVMNNVTNNVTNNQTFKNAIEDVVMVGSDCDIGALTKRITYLEGQLSAMTKEIEFLRNRATAVINNSNTYQANSNSNAMTNLGSMNDNINNNNNNNESKEPKESEDTLCVHNMGSANEEFVSKGMWKKLVNNPSTEDAVLELVEKLHFSPTHPENMSIFAHPRMNDTCVVMKNNGWTHENMSEVVHNLVESTAERLSFETQSESPSRYSIVDCKRIDDFVTKCYDVDQQVSIGDILGKVEECVRNHSRKVIRTLTRKGIDLTPA
eukprot:gene28528-31688_t